MWGYLRETTDDALKAGLHPTTKLNRTGLDEYLRKIFPSTTDWVHNKITGRYFNGKKLLTRPDYRSDRLMMIVEFDGIPHYQNPIVIKRDKTTTKIYEQLGYKVIRIPYFIQLTNAVIFELFGVKIEDQMFPDCYPSLDSANGAPASLCLAGIERMAREFMKFPDQYRLNIDSLRNLNDNYVSGVDVLEHIYTALRNDPSKHIEDILFA